MKRKPIATVHIHGANRFTKKGRAKIAAWLRRHAADLVRHGENYATRFRGRYFAA